MPWARVKHGLNRRNGLNYGLNPGFMKGPEEAIFVSFFVGRYSAFMPTATGIQSLFFPVDRFLWFCPNLTK